LGGALDIGAVLRVFFKSAKGPDACHQNDENVQLKSCNVRRRANFEPKTAQVVLSALKRTLNNVRMKTMIDRKMANQNYVCLRGRRSPQ
jgi:hypothetical protein